MEETISLHKQTSSNLQLDETYQLRFSSAVQDEKWDAFLRQTDSGALLQSSRWASLKQYTGWQIHRLIVEQNRHIVAGSQLLLRSLPFPLGKIAYVPRGPILAVDTPELGALILKKLQAVARAERLQLLIIQPPHTYKALSHNLITLKFRPTQVKIAPRSTMQIDLRCSHDDILAQMRRGTRANIRRGNRKGIVIRHGNEEDVGVFMKLHAASSKRQGFSTASEDYYAQMWRLFVETGDGALLISEYGGEPISAMLVIGFGKTVWAKRFGWSGKQGKRKPNEILIWSAMKWAKSQGYHWFDQDGVKWEAAEALLNKQAVSESVKKSPSYFKLGFGGQPRLFPEATAYVYNPILRFGYTSLFPKLSRWSVTKRLLKKMQLG